VEGCIVLPRIAEARREGTVMSGEDQSERGTPPDGMRARAAKAEAPHAATGGGPPPLPPEQAPAAAPAARVRKAKPPPGIIMAGGVDMARGHAANIQPKALGSAQTPAVPRVVVSVETDPRRVPTAPRLIPAGRAPANATTNDGKASPWGAIAVEVVDKRDLPSANLPVTAPAPAAPEEKKGGGWLRYAVVLVLLLLAAGIVRRVRMAAGPDTSDAPQRTIAVAPPLPPEATADPTATAAPARRHYQGGALPAGADPAADLNAAAEADLLDAGIDPDASAEEELDAAVPRPRVAPPPPKPTFKPLFELPQEKAKE
jgi:hypothetical protein